jgi:MFS family permease
MYSAASAWLMTSLNPDPVMVALVQAAATFPMFILAVPAGALADILDKRVLLLFGEIGITVTATIFAAVVWLDRASPLNILLFTLLSSSAVALTWPAWQAVIPQIVPKPDLSAAIAANSVGMNVSRAIGPALSGVLAGGFGISGPFWVNAFSNLGVLAALFWWRPAKQAKSALPVERFGSAMRTGLRHARHNSDLRATLVRTVMFFLFGSAYWALLPLVTRSQLAGGPAEYGYLLSAIGASAVLGALLLPHLEKRIGGDSIVVGGSVGTALALVLFGLAANWGMALVASILAGASWIAVVASLNVSAQVALPDWVRGRGLAMFVSVFFGALALGSGIWGFVADAVGVSMAHFVAAAGLILGIPAGLRWRLHTGAHLDLAPSMQWPSPVLDLPVAEARGPVLVNVDYRIHPDDRQPFLAAIEKLGHERKRDGAYAWGVFEDPTREGRFLEAFLVESWVEYLRQHERLTRRGRCSQKTVASFLDGREPKVSHWVAAEQKGRFSTRFKKRWR